MWGRSTKQRKAAERRRRERDVARRELEASLRLWRGYVESDGPRPTSALVQAVFDRAWSKLQAGERVLQ